MDKQPTSQTLVAVLFNGCGIRYNRGTRMGPFSRRGNVYNISCSVHILTV